MKPFTILKISSYWLTRGFNLKYSFTGIDKTRSCTHTHTHTHTYIYIRVCLCVCVCVCVCVAFDLGLLLVSLPQDPATNQSHVWHWRYQHCKCTSHIELWRFTVFLCLCGHAPGGRSYFMDLLICRHMRPLVNCPAGRAKNESTSSPAEW